MPEQSPLSAGNSTAYIDALLAYLGDREPLEVFAETPEKLREAVQAVPENRLAIPEAPGKWSIRDVIQHLAQAEMSLGFRYRKVLAEDAPALPAIEQDRWVAALYPDEVSLEEALEEFTALRARNLRLLRRVDREQWQRYGMHTERGKETLEHMVRLYAAHDLYHLFQIDRIHKAVAG